MWNMLNSLMAPYLTGHYIGEIKVTFEKGRLHKATLCTCSKAQLPAELLICGQ